MVDTDVVNSTGGLPLSTMHLPASTRAVSGEPGSSTNGSAMRRTPLSKLPFSHPRVFRRHEKLSDKLWRYRGVMLAVGAPLLIILFVMGVMFPRSAPPAERPLHGSGGGATAAGGGGGGGGAHVYSIVLDAGSTGSRIHVFKFQRAGGELRLISDTFEQLKPGLSSFRDEPQKAAESLRPLMETALKAVPKEQQAATGLSLKATAGLRLLPGSKADDILKAVTAFLKAYPFKMGEDAVGIMDGAHEGAYAWLTLNYLLGKLGKGPAATVAAIDLGGGSVQEAFALPDDGAAAAPSGYVTKLRAGGNTYSVYVHSYLGYGLMAARAKVIESGRVSPEGHKGHPCFAKGTKLKYSYADKEYSVDEVVDAGDFKRCAAAAFRALDHDKDCGQPKETCSFSGVWRGKPEAMRRVYYVSSYFWDRALDSGIIPDKQAIEFKTSPGEFARRAAAVCGKDPAEVAKQYGLSEAHAPYFCLDLSFCHTVLTQGFDLAEGTALNLVKQVKYNGQTIEAAWPLGAAIDELSGP